MKRYIANGKEKHLRLCYWLLPALVLLLLAEGGLYLAESCRYSRLNSRELPKTIAHAMGGIDGASYTNSLEAFEYNYRQGCRLFEIDLVMTSDGELICAHDGFSEADPFTLEEFLIRKSSSNFTPLTFSDVLELLREYPDAMIVTDTKYTEPDTVGVQFRRMHQLVQGKKASDVLNRMIVQLYNEQMLPVVRKELPGTAYLFTLYQVWDSTEEAFESLCGYCIEQKITYMAMFARYVTEGIMKIADSHGIRLYAHTVNDAAERDRLYALGVYGIYTDFLLPE